MNASQRSRRQLRFEEMPEETELTESSRLLSTPTAGMLLDAWRQRVDKPEVITSTVADHGLYGSIVLSMGSRSRRRLSLRAAAPENVHIGAASPTTHASNERAPRLLTHAHTPGDTQP